jgi:excisionase family DNA binding protein
MTDSGALASRNWNSTTRLSAEQERSRILDLPIITGALGVGPGGRPRLDPTHILGCSREEAVELFHGRPVTPGEAEAIAERSYRWRRHVHDPQSYWITTSEAARILELTPRQVKRLLDRGRLQHVRHVSRVRLMRRAHIVALAESTY